MAKPTSEDECVDRHKDYKFDVWEDSMNSLQRTRIDWLISQIPSGIRCLDVGCNSGYMALLTDGCIWHGIDVNPELVEKAKKRMFHAQVARAEELPFPEDSFDLSCIAEILEHVHDPKKVLDEANRVTKDRIIGSTPHDKGNWGHDGIHPVKDHQYHVRCYTEESLLELLQPYGTATLTIIKDKYGRPQMFGFVIDLEK